MQAIVKLQNRVAQAVSDDGRVAVLDTPLTRLNGNYVLRDTATGAEMWRGEYLGADGKCSGQRVPANVWETAVALMREIDAANGTAEDAQADRAHAYQAARHTALAARIGADMDRPDSDL